MPTIVFVHGMFQNPVSWNGWIEFFKGKGYDGIAPPWPLHEGDPAELRAHPPAGLGKLPLNDVIASVERVVGDGKPIMIGHSVGGLVTQILMSRGLISAGIVLSSVAPNAMLDLDWGFLKNSAIITNPLKGDDPIYMDAKTFHGAFANTLGEAEARAAFERTATHDSRNVLRDCLGADGRIDLDRPHGPLLLLGGEKDEIVPAHLCEKNAHAYSDPGSITANRSFTNRSHFICNEPDWEEVAGYAAQWLSEIGM